ncbi:MAG: GTP cyclohydrolase I FolE2 [Bacteroidetes bacterium]|nr:GTP cyclohydrolase I FolE2 [Bacteroidota bacterium]
MEDTQSRTDERKLPIQKVGIKNIRYPLAVSNGNGNLQHTVATFDMAVELPQDQKGTHMSRFVEALNEFQESVSLSGIQRLVNVLKKKLPSPGVFLRVEFPYFLEKKAPVTGSASMMDYTIILTAESHEDDRITATLIIPVTTLCPCSKNISEYGAHNQRGLVELHVRFADPATADFDRLIRCVEETSSCEVFALLKREDEKFVTERAYENPVFVEDLVRDIALKLAKEGNVNWFKVEVTNFESIHHHDAYAMIDSDHISGFRTLEALAATVKTK